MNVQLSRSQKSNRFMPQNAIKLIALMAITITATSNLYAQQVYKSVDKNGRVTYSEVPPLPGSGYKLTGDSAANPSLPYSLQQVVSRYPVTLYTTDRKSTRLNSSHQ